MQDMSGVINEPVSSPPMTLATDPAVEKSVTDAKENKTKITPKINKDEPDLEKEKSAVNATTGGTADPDNADNQKDLACKYCEKVLGSSSSLDRHLLVHSGERPFRCKMCDLTFNTNGNMHRHMRSHKQKQDSDSEDSEVSGSGAKASAPRMPNTRKRRLEYNNNDKTTNGSGGNSADDEQAPGGKRKSKNINNNSINDSVSAQRLVCPVCDREDFASLNVFEIHMEEAHPDFQVKCISCNQSFKNHRVLNLHRFMVHHTERKDSPNKKVAANSVSGFKDCTFIDFSSQKFPQIAKTVCEQSVHKSVTEQAFSCDQCSRDFPCESALEIHRKTCVATSSGESEDYKRRRESSSTDEDIRRDDFFANLDLQNKSPNYTAAPRPTADARKVSVPNEYYPFSKDMIRPLVDNSKDLADIQSMISVTSVGGLFEPLTHKSHEVASLTPDHGSRGNDDHEEVQDVFAAEFRKMKLRGEFPCRLCTAIFPNLRALKGHNRVHLSGNGPGPYRCNMCPQSSLDKAALVRHMRTHNGDRPYECAVCNYAFTTKANCERHLRNRHSKVTREEVKRAIIYHPSEDPNNDEVNSKLNISREDIKRSLIFSTPENDHREDAERQHGDSTHSTPVSHFSRESTIAFKDRNLTIPLPRDLSIVVPQPREILRAHCSVDPVCHIIPQAAEELAQPRLKVKGFGQLTQIPEFSESDAEREPDSDEDMEQAEDTYPDKSANYACEVPMDLSTGEYQEDVLDLSKKKVEKVEDTPVSDAETDNFLPKTIEFDNNTAAATAMFEKTQLFLAQQQLLKGAHLQKLDPAASFYANQLSQLYRTGTAFPGLGIPPAFPLNPYFLQHAPFLSPPTNPKELADMKERIQKEIIRGLQLSGGGLVGMDQRNIVNNMALATERLQAFHQQAMGNAASPDSPHTPVPFIKTEEDVKPPLHINTDSPTTAAPFPNPIMSSPKIHKKEVISNHSPNSVKMVIKNGVLMPKQKQRRYRTERPFSCEHCSARFTLRSNMERHIKQQHPQYWSQRQRSNIGLPRKNPISLVPQNITVPSLNYENRLNYIKNITHSELPNNNSNSGEEKDASSNNASNLPVNKTYSMISDQVKYAILAQQLKSHNIYTQPKLSQNKTEPPIPENEEEDEDDALVIDEEESVDDKSQVVKDLQSKTASENVQPQQTDSNLMAKKVAQEILIGVSAKTQQPDISKDFDWKIAGSLISKNPQHHASQNLVIPTFVSQIGQNGEIDVVQPESNTNKESKQEEGDLVSVSRLLDNAVTQIPFGKYFKNDFVANAEVQPRNDSSMQHQGEGSEEDEEGLVASSGSTSEGNNSGSDENRSESENTAQVPQKKKSAYSLAPNRVSCQYCHRKFPWSSSLRRHILTHTGQKPYKCLFCPLLFTTKSNCDRHLLRKHGSQIQQTQMNAATVNNADIPPNSVSIPGLGNQGFMMRNVPERPYKCASCPSSTFSTLSNLKKHMSSKHGIQIDESRPGSPKMDEGNQSPAESGDEPHLTSDDEKKYNDTEMDSFSRKAANNSLESNVNRTEWDSQISTSKYSPSYLQDVPSNMQNSDLPFKCHLCDQSYAERQDALDHIKDIHSSEYELLMSKGSLETSAPFGEELGSSTPDRGHRSEGGDEQGEENGEQLRGKFPDYANRKVVCAFCMRRFWSAEDLRRHMRTHTGERPFSCNVCQRRFTLKHSMLRHRKKHVDSLSCEDLSTASGDEETASPSGSSQNYSKSTNSTFSPLNFSYASSTNTSTSTPKNSHLTLNGYQMAINKNLSPDVPSNVNNNNSPPSQSYEGQVKVHNIKRDDNTGTDDQENESGNDLIGNLLGIDERVINKLLSSPDEAAKLLGMNK